MAKTRGPNDSGVRTLHAGEHLALVARDSWEFVTRPNASGIVMIVAVTDEDELVLIEQHRPALGANTIELPAGLAGDEPGAADESLADAARRELLEETGYEAESLECVADGATSAGLCDEIVTVFLARELRRVHEGGGDDSEDITVHLVPLDRVESWIEEQKHARGVQADLKIYAGLYFAKRG